MPTNPTPEVREALTSLLYRIWSTEISSADAAIIAAFPSLAAPKGWRPIESAPFQTDVIVFWPCMEVGEDGELTGKPADGEEGHVGVSRRYGAINGWEDDACVESAWQEDEWEYGTPTHWQPLPPPPEQKEG